MEGVQSSWSAQVFLRAAGTSIFLRVVLAFLQLPRKAFMSSS